LWSTFIADLDPPVWIIDVSGDPIVVLFSRFERRRFLRPYSSAEIYFNRFLPVDLVAAVVGARAVPAAMHA
jgi:hypothetical protein